MSAVCHTCTSLFTVGYTCCMSCQYYMSAVCHPHTFLHQHVYGRVYIILSCHPHLTLHQHVYGGVYIILSFHPYLLPAPLPHPILHQPVYGEVCIILSCHPHLTLQQSVYGGIYIILSCHPHPSLHQHVYGGYILYCPATPTHFPFPSHTQSCTSMFMVGIYYTVLPPLPTSRSPLTPNPAPACLWWVYIILSCHPYLLPAPLPHPSLHQHVYGGYILYCPATPTHFLLPSHIQSCISLFMMRYVLYCHTNMSAAGIK